MRRTRHGSLLLLLLFLAVSCTDPMRNQPRAEPLESSRFFADGAASRTPVPGTIPRGHLNEDELLATGREGGELAERFPFEVTMAVMERGRERYDIFCSACHGLTGDGRGIVVQRGFRAPRSFHEPELVAKPVGHFVDVVTLGFGAMSPYARQVAPRDRWAIAAYIRALQRSRDGRLEDVPAGERPALERSR